MPRFLLVLDTPGIKNFVFGTDSLAEVRGASALLDDLNRHQTEPTLRRVLLRAGESVQSVYCNGGSGQFILQASDPARCTEALEELARYYREKTGGEARIVWGLSEWRNDPDYSPALQEAHFQMRLTREMASDQRVATLLPFFKECESASHLPATPPAFYWGGERLLLSEASKIKRQESIDARFDGIWAGWMQHLHKQGPWPDDPSTWARRLRCADASRIPGEVADKRGARQDYVALVYADGNSMGQLVQALPDPATFKSFSTIVDQSIRRACHVALDTVTEPEIRRVREAPDNPRSLPADILLLGGDDLMVLLPAGRALPFALEATRLFEEFTREGIRGLVGLAKDFFDKHLVGNALTISCGVAIAPAAYPFYLLLELAEELLKNAKKAGSSDPELMKKLAAAGDKKIVPAPACVDFHLVTGASSHNIATVRLEDYQVSKDRRLEVLHHRTLRPYRRDRLLDLRRAVASLRQPKARLPRSKQHDLLDSALEPRPEKARQLVKELFSRCKPDQRRALMHALNTLAPVDRFPWSLVNGGRPATDMPLVADPGPAGKGAPQKCFVTALADLMEAIDLFPEEK